MLGMSTTAEKSDKLHATPNEWMKSNIMMMSVRRVVSDDYGVGPGVIKGRSALRATAAPPQEAGGAVPGSTQGLRYVQVAIGTCMPAVSDGFSQPSPALMELVNVGTANVGIVPVGV